MAIRVYFSDQEATNIVGLKRELGQQPYFSFPDIEAVPGERFHDKGFWTYREDFSSKDGYDFRPGKYVLQVETKQPHRERATLLIESQKKGSFTVYTVKGRFHSFEALADSVEQLKYGDFPTLKLSFAIGLLLQSLLSELMFFKKLRFS